jgi:HlyD family secretion protein
MGVAVKRRIVIGLLIAGTLGLFIAWKTRPVPLVVAVATVERGMVEATVANTRAGTIKACRRAGVSMPIGGVVDRLLVDEGDRVEAGQLMLELWNRDRHAEVLRSEAALLAASHARDQACVMAQRGEREAQRLEKLLARKLASEDLVDAARSNAQAARGACEAARAQASVAAAQLESARALFDRTQLRAPFAGVVAKINGEVGEYITPSPPGVATPPAVDLIDTSCLYVTAPIDEVDAAALRIGLPVRVTLDAFRGRSFDGRLTRIAPYVVDLERQARTVDIDVQLDAPPDDVVLLVGYSADVSVVLDSRADALRIPTEALVDGNAVWVIDGGVLRKRALQLGIGNWSWTEVVQGLAAGDRIVRTPDQPGIADGVRAEPRDESPR